MLAVVSPPRWRPTQTTADRPAAKEQGLAEINGAQPCVSRAGPRAPVAWPFTLPALPIHSASTSTSRPPLVPRATPERNAQHSGPPSVSGVRSRAAKKGSFSEPGSGGGEPAGGGPGEEGAPRLQGKASRAGGKEQARPYRGGGQRAATQARPDKRPDKPLSRNPSGRTGYTGGRAGAALPARRGGRGSAAAAARSYSGASCGASAARCFPRAGATPLGRSCGATGRRRAGKLDNRNWKVSGRVPPLGLVGG
jgi:hypothetical protein